MKLKEFQSRLRKEGINLAFLNHPDSNLTYFTQLKPSSALLAISPKNAHLFLSKLDLRPRLKGINLKPLNRKWAENFNSKKIKKIGINKEVLSVSAQEKLKKHFPRAKFIDLSSKISSLRAEKTSLEIKKIRQAAKITSAAFNQLLPLLKKKKFSTEQDIAFFLEKTMYEQGAGSAFPIIVASGKNTAVPHHQTSQTRLKKGFLLLDFGTCYQNYCADMTRMVYLGTPTEKEKELYRFLQHAQQGTIQQISKQKRFSELDRFTRKELKSYSSYFIHSLGHGIGIDVHEAPSFAPENKQTVQNGQVFTIEPGIYFPQKFGLRIEDTLLFDGRAKILTTASKELTAIK